MPAPPWQARNNFSRADFLSSDDLNALANDDRTWGGNVNGGGYILSNVILQGSGGFQFQTSPVEVTPGSAGTSCLQLDQTVASVPAARWTVCKDATAETGSNTGSNFAIARYSDAGAVLSTPIAINRATGLITMGAQQWAGAVNGGGNTLSNVVLSGVTVPGTVPTTRMINTGAGLSGGGSLAADLTLTANVVSVFGRTGAIVFAATELMGASGASHAAGIVPDPGATLGATRYLREDATWAVPAGGTGGGMSDPTTTKGDLIVRGPAATTRLGVGADGTVLTADSTQATGVKWGTGGGAQTPWTSNINANNFSLVSVAAIGLKIANPLRELHVAGVVGGGGLAITGVGPSIAISNADTEPNTNTLAFTIALATAAGHYGLPNAGDSAIITQGTARGDIYINANYSGGGALRNVYLQQAGGSVVVGSGSPAALGQLVVSGAAQNVICAVSSSTDTGILMVNSATNGCNYELYASGGTSGLGAGNFTIYDNLVGASRFVITKTGTVGINATAPAGVLDVRSLAKSAATVSSICMTSQDATNPMQASFTLCGAASANPRLVIGCVEQNVAYRAVTFCEAGGNVGVGTTTPQSQLAVIPITNPTTPATAVQFTIGESTNNLNYRMTLGYFGDSGIYKGAIQSLHSNSGTASALCLNPLGGPVGIGTIAPSDVLAVRPPSGQAGITIRHQTSGPTSESTLSVLHAVAGYGWRARARDVDGGFTLDVQNNNSAWLNVISVNSASGAVGILKTTPGYAVDVAGDVNCTGTFRVNGVALGSSSGGPTTFSQPGKVANTIYQNGTGKALYVGVAFNLASASSNIIAYIGGSSPPTTPVAATGSGTGYASLFFIVLPGQFYQATTAGPTPTLYSWGEWN